MIIEKLNNMIRGWFIGDFEPCVYRTREFEVGVLTHRKNEQWDEHYHKIANEINVLIEGKMIINGVHIEAGDIFIIKPNESSAPVFLEDCKIVCVKTPSVIGDKYAIIRE